jgi:hypothetical protein
MAKKRFTNKNYPEIAYEVVFEGWNDDETYVIVFNEMKDVDGDVFHLEVEFHKDENKVTYTRVYDYETLSGAEYVSPCFKKQIDEYILQQVGKLRKGSMLKKHIVEIELSLDVPLDMTVGELQNWLKNELKVSVMTPLNSKVEILKVNK